jgi:hypothetical protein
MLVFTLYIEGAQFHHGLTFLLQAFKAGSTMSFFDRLPSEIILHIAQYLAGKDLLVFADTSERFAEIIKRSSRALSKAGCRMSFFRNITDCDYDVPLRRCDTTFNFINDGQDRVKFLLDLLPKLKTGGRLTGHRKVVIVLADGQLEAQDLFFALLGEGQRAYLSFGYIPLRIRYQYLADISNYYIVCGWLETQMDLGPVAAFINFQEPSSLEKFLDVQSFAPRRVYQVLTATATGYDMFMKIRHFLGPHSGAYPEPSKALEISKEYYEKLRLEKKKARFSEIRKRLN